MPDVQGSFSCGAKRRGGKGLEQDAWSSFCNCARGFLFSLRVRLFTAECLGLIPAPKRSHLHAIPRTQVLEFHPVDLRSQPRDPFRRFCTLVCFCRRSPRRELQHVSAKFPVVRDEARFGGANGRADLRRLDRLCGRALPSSMAPLLNLPRCSSPGGVCRYLSWLN